MPFFTRIVLLTWKFLCGWWYKIQTWYFWITISFVSTVTLCITSCWKVTDMLYNLQTEVVWCSKKAWCKFCSFNVMFDICASKDSKIKIVLDAFIVIPNNCLFVVPRLFLVRSTFGTLYSFRFSDMFSWIIGLQKNIALQSYFYM